MKNEPIIIERKYLFFRDDANHLETIARKTRGATIYFDFSKVSFFSRSFGDELINMIEGLKKEKKTIKINNLKPKLAVFLKQIKDRKNKIRKEL